MSPEPSPSSSMFRRTRSVSLQPGPSKKRPRRARVAPEPSVVEIIELTDSDDDLYPAPRPPRALHGEQGPSSVAISSAFGRPNADILTDALVLAPGPLQHAARRRQHGDGVPLFLPGSDDELRADQHSPPVPVAQAIHDQPTRPAMAPVPVDPIDEYIIRVLEVVPDVQPTHALQLFEEFMQSQPENVVEFVLHAIFENPTYPRVDKKGKHKRDEPDGDPNIRGSPRPRIDYTSKERVYDCGPHYFECALEHLMLDFPRIPKPYIRSRLLDNRFYAPTYLLLADELKQDPLPFKLKLTNSVIGKGKGKARQDAEFDKEREWVLLKATEMASEQDATLVAVVNEQEYEDHGEGIECGCCFSPYPFDQMIQCPEAHLFCKSCMTSYASNLLGEHNPNIVCMDQSGCKHPFPESELNRFLSFKLLELYYRVKQRKEIEAAGLDNLEECPFCEYKCVIENEMEKLFRCENAECNAITCRACKKLDHLPKSCKEAEADKHLDAQHVIEEAMTQALMRNCPKCQKSFIKEMGCNKMTCPNCHTVSCYVCRKIIVGYDHFSNPPPYSNKVDKSKCNLWDPIEQRHAEEVAEAAKRALAELRQSRPDVDESSLKVDIPVAQAPLLSAPEPVVGGAPLVPPHYMALAAGMGVGGRARAGPPNGPRPLLGLVPHYAQAMAAAAGVGVGGARLIPVPAAVPAPAPGPGLVGNAFVFGAGDVHPFGMMGFGAGAMGRVGPRVEPEPGIPLALARGRRAPPAVPVPAAQQPVVAAGGGGRRRKGR